MAAKKDEILLAERLVKLEEGQKSISEKMDLHHQNLTLQLAPLIDLKQEVREHDRSINRWKGANAVMAGIITLIAAFFGKLHLWHS